MYNPSRIVEIRGQITVKGKNVGSMLRDRQEYYTFIWAIYHENSKT
jgi:hypothetical protein